MSTRQSLGDLTVPAVILTMFASLAAGWWLRDAAERGVVPPPVAEVDGIALPRVTGDAVPAAHVKGETIGADAVAELRRQDLKLPIDDAEVDEMKGDFAERRGGGSRAHEAVDILAPRHTPIRAVDDGSIARLFQSKAGGTTIYQFDPEQRFCYYYAHLQRYAAGLSEGMKVSKGDIIGYVGTTGNAPPNTPHLHFAIFQLTDEKRWWDGKPVDPYLIFRD
jgi:hypothetical protein